MKICFVVNSVYNQLPTYTTTHLAFAASQRGHQVVYTTVNSFTFGVDHRIRATTLAAPRARYGNPADFLRAIRSDEAQRKELCLSDYDVVFLRQNPHDVVAAPEKNRNPAIEFCRILKSQGVMVLNDPVGLSRAAGKMYLTSFPSEIRAKTIITRNPIKIKAFLKKLKKPAIIKPLRGFGGQDVFFVGTPSEININQIITAVSKNGYVVVQEYLPAARTGEKRLLLLDGSPIVIGGQPSIYTRVSPKGEIRSNMHLGGKRRRAKFTKTEKHIVEVIRPRLIAHGLYLVGVDIVGDKLLEINVFCPGGINNIDELYQVNLGETIIKDLEKRVRISQTHHKGVCSQVSVQPIVH